MSKRTGSVERRRPLERATRIILLNDYYGALLTRRQREILAMHYESDLSLGEIGQLLGISRQAVHDLLSRAEEALEGYEKLLGLAERDAAGRRLVGSLAHVVARLEVEHPLRARLDRLIEQLKARFY